jgi:choice-of-anchor C domain-containing protein
MRPSLRCAAAALAALSLPVLPLSASAAPLVNGNFEDGPVIALANPVFAVSPGDPSLNGWSVSGGIVCIVTDNYWVPLSGHRSVCLSDMRPGSTSTVPGSIAQSFASAPGAVYRLTFWMSGEPFSTPTLKHLRVNAAATTQDYTFDNTPAWHWDMAWAPHTLDFAATGASTTVRLSGLDASQWGTALDSMKVELVSAGVPVSNTLAFAPVSPDPVRANGRFAFSLAAPGPARLAVYDVQGRQLALLADGPLEAGPHTLEFSPQAWGARPGLYLAVLRTGAQTLVRRFTVLD